MSETSQSVGRIAVLTACTLLFAAAWRGDASSSVRPGTVLGAIRRQSGTLQETGVRGAIADGLIAARPLTVVGTFPARNNGQLLVQTPTREPAAAALFSGTPALLGRSTPAVAAGDTALTTASTTVEPTR